MLPGNAKYWALAAIGLLCAGQLPANAQTRVNLLKLPSAALETTSLVGDRAVNAAPLTDGDRQSVASINPGETGTIDLVFSFAGETVAPEAVAVVLAPGKDAVPPARVEVLASTLSPQSGFKSLRADPVNRSTQVQNFAFPPSAARWIMIRLTPAKKGETAALAEVEILGHPGQPKTNYAFAEAPARAIDTLSRLQSASPVALAVSPDEKRVFEKARAGRLDPATFADAALMASGVLDPDKRKTYLARIEALATRAKAAVASVRDQKERGDQLLRWLHKEALKGGYRSTQTDLSVLLDSQTFNCVSSAALYNIIAVRLGIDARAIEVPDHAFSIVYQGAAHMDVETTNAQGFNPARDQIEKFEKLTGFRYIEDNHRDQRREVTEAGLVALIYYNKGVELNKAKRHHDALLAYFRAMSLDPEFASAVKNALATLANWGIELSEQRQWQQAVDVVTIGVALAPKDAALTNNQRAIWSRWAMALIDGGQRDEALAVMKRASLALPSGGFEEMQSWAYLKFAEDLVKARNWQAAYAMTDAGLSVLPPKAREELVDWRNNLHLRWASTEIRESRFDAAATALSQGIGVMPDNKRLREMVAYLGQEWAKKEAAGGFGKGLAVLAALDRQFPDTAVLGESVKYYVSKQVQALVDKGSVEEALASIEQSRGLMKSGKTAQELGVFAFDTGAKSRMKAGAWDEASDLYARGIKQYPDDGLLKNNAAYMAQEWLKAASASGGASAVAVITTKLAAKFPNIGSIAESGAAHIRRAVGDHVKAGQFEKAVEALKDGASQLNAAGLKEMNEHIYDSWAKKKMAAKDWQGAADVYAAGLAATGGSNLFENNIGFLAQEWQNAAYAAGGAQDIAAIAGKLAQQFPGIRGIAESGKNQIQRAIAEQLKSNNFDKALATLKSASSLLPASDMRDFNEHIYDSWAHAKMSAKDWQGAADLYAAGLATTGGTSLLQNNAAYFAQEWAQAALAQGGVEAIIPVARQIGEKFSQAPNASQSLISVVSREVNRKVSAGDHESAVALAEKSADFLPKDEAARLMEFSYDRWARKFFGAKQWKEAIKIYDRGLERLPDNGLFKQNKAYCESQDG